MIRKVSTTALVAAAVFAASGCTNASTARDQFIRSGDRYLAEGRLTEASIEYRNAAQRDPDSVEAQRKLAETYVASNQPDKALSAYETLSDLDRNSVPARLRASSLLAAAGELERAASRARDAIALAPKNVDAHILLAQALVGMRRPDEAMQQLFDAIAANPEEAATYAAIGELHLARGARADAEASFLKAVEIDPSSVRARLSVGEYYWITGRAADAEAQLRSAVDLAPRDRLANRAYALFLMATERGSSAEPHWKAVAAESTNASGKLELADYYLWSGRSRDALAVVEPLATHDVTGGAATRVSAILYGLGDKDRAKDLLTSELSIRKSNAAAQLLMGRFLMDEQRWDDAAQHARRVTALERESWAAYDLLGSAQAAAGNLREAAESLREASRLRPGATGPRVKLAAAYASVGDTNTALFTLEEAFARGRENAVAAANNIAWNLSRDERTRDAALTLATYATEKLPKRAEPWDTLGSIHLLRGEVPQAIAAFENSVRLAPEKVAYRSRLNEARRRLQ
jgi:tetratricopeptide (TPR) repeat protein